ncbi:ribonuclease H-like domain-containing protein [Tanacetum coccineum]
MRAPLKSHFDIALKVLKYLKLAPGLGLGVEFSKRKSDCVITAFSDSDWVCVLWTRRSMASTTCEIMWIVKLLGEFGIKNVVPIDLYCDNQSTIQIVANPLLGLINILSSFKLQNACLFANLHQSCRADYVASAHLLEQWDRCNAVVLNWILSSLSQDAYLVHVFSDNAASVWNKLKEYDRIDGSIIFNLLQKINSFKQGGLYVSEYYYKLNSLWREFAILTKLPDCTCAAKAELNDHGKLLKLMKFLMGLDDVYQPIRSSLLTRQILPEVKDAFVIISREESYRGIPSSSVKIEKPQVSAFVSRPNDNKEEETLIGTICFKIIGYPPGFKRKPNLKPFGNFNNNITSFADTKDTFMGNNDVKTYASTVSLTNEQVMKLVNHFNEKSCSSANANMADGSGDSPCEVCDKAKETRDAFPLSEHKSTVFAKLFGCICLSLKMKSMKCLLVLTQFDKKIKVVKSNNGTEFVNHKMNEFFTTMGIIHQTSCAYTPQQNGIAKRKRRHLLNVARGLMFHGEIPLFLSECILTATYLINMLPSLILNGKYPFSLVYGRKPNLSHLRIFGCLCFATMVKGSDKFSHSLGRDGRVHQPDVGAITDHVGHNGELSATPIVGPRRSQRSSKLPAKLNEFVLDNKVNYSLNRYANHSMLSPKNYNFVSNMNKSSEPSSYEEALKDVNWINALNDEMHALYENTTWFMTDLPIGRKPIGCKWGFRIKYKSNGEVERYKAKLVAKGFS